MAEYRGLAIAIDQEELIEGYKRGDHRDPAWDDDAIKLLEMYIASINADPDAGTYKEIRQFAKSVANRGCEDPLVTMSLGGRSSQTRT